MEPALKPQETVETRHIKTLLDGRLLNGESRGVVWKTVPRLCGVFFLLVGLQLQVYDLKPQGENTCL